MKTLIIIPARMASTRLPRKPLHPLKGAMGDEKSLIRRCYEAAAQVGADDLVVATDDDEIALHVRDFGGEALITSADCQNGTERCAEIARDVDADLIINFQGDAPLIPPDFVTVLMDYMKANADVDMATPVMACDRFMLAALREDRMAGRVGGTTACFAENGRALYFSKEVLPISDVIVETKPEEVFLHIGLYAYRRETLAQYAGWPLGRLERIEALEQLRFLENGKTVACVPVEAKGRAFWEVNLPEDVPRVEAALKQRGIE